MRPHELRGARRCFGSWTKAVIAAGINPERLQRVPAWTKERVLESILLRALNNQPMGSRTVKPRNLADAGAKYFGTWRSALAAAGVEHNAKAIQDPIKPCQIAAPE